MKIVQLDNVLKREDPDELYDITKITFTYPNASNIKIGTYYVTEFEEMRMDLISNNIYGTIDYVDFLCSLNNIKNPLSVRRGMEILYVNKDEITQFKTSNASGDVARKVISNRRKRAKIDNNRTKYLEENLFSLPPTITKKDYKAVKYKNGKISIGNDIFNV
jgi:hypothetical protein